MPAILNEPLSTATVRDLPHHVWTRAECKVLEGTGLLEPGRYELIEGELVHKMGKSMAHVGALIRLTQWLREWFGYVNVVSEGPVDVSPEDNPTSEPEPDVLVLRRSALEYAASPAPADVLLAAEIAGSTLPNDLGVKARLYARAGIVEYWVLDLQNRRMVVHREPVDGQYRLIAVYAENEEIAPLAKPEARSLVSRFL